MSLEVEDPQAFVDNNASEAAMVTAVAAAADVDESQVTVRLSVGTRRLLLAEVSRRLQGTVIVASNITMAGADEASDLRTSIATVTPEAMTVHANTALEAAGVNVTVAITQPITIAEPAANGAGSGTSDGTGLAKQGEASTALASRASGLATACAIAMAAARF